MRIRLSILMLGSVAVFAVSDGSHARAAATVAPAPVVTPAAQFYVLSFNEAPIAEVAEAVVGGALSQDLAIDPALDGTMSFSAEGRFTPDALLQEFGTAALDQDVALMRSRAGALSLVPRSNMAAELARGSLLVALPPSGPAPATPALPAVTPPVIYGAARWWEGPVGGLLIFLTGAASGAAALFAAQRLLQPAGPASSTLVRISHAVTVPDPAANRSAPEDTELTIPRFEPRSRDEQV
ncbi:hypothetical protein [Brevundimonas variabilis]|uniref:Uncharacterized protein n=1 Tax=Brevundimonas variabilis TaxID=74312 RepID=A0A7W9CGX7_9CAUL|nr:hypothetical protein [Brevundimonas variabilis]MBB5745296.1 hypothetical protein [Brevundimonas variabilis]